MENHFIYLTFDNPEEIEPTVIFFRDNAISYKIEEISVNLIPYLQEGNTYGKYGLFVHKNDRFRLEELIEKHTTEEDINTDPLNDFSDEELLEVVGKKDEWSPEEFVIAQKILKKRGKSLSENEVENLFKKRLNELKQPREADPVMVIIAFLLPMLGIYAMGRIGILGSISYLMSVGIGLNYLLDYRRLPDGKKYFHYTQKARKTGYLIIAWALFLGLLGLILLLGFRHLFSPVQQIAT